MKLSSLLIIISLILFNCSPKNEKKENQAETVETPLPKDFKTEGDSIVLPSFEITIELSKKAEKKLINDNETIIVQAYLAGNPKDSAPSLLVDEMGQMNLGSPKVELSKPGVAVFKDVKVLRSTYNQLEDKDFQILINVFSGRKSSDLNLLDCDILEEPISKVKNKNRILKGKLIGE